MTAADLHAIRHRMTVAEAVAYSRKSDKTLREALGTGELHGRQFTTPGGRWTIRADCLEAWLDGERCPHGKGAAA